MCNFFNDIYQQILLIGASNWIQMGIAVILIITAYLQYKLHKIQNDLYVPNIEVGLEGKEGSFDLVILNTGNIAAHNIKFTIEPDLEFKCSADKKKKLLSQHSVFKRGIATLLPNQYCPSSKIEMFLGIQFKGNDSYISFDTEFDINITYTDKKGKKYTNKSIISFKAHEDITWLEKT